MEIRTGCKINLGLEITGVLPNGYHTLDSVFYPLARPFDVLEVERREAAGRGMLMTRYARVASGKSDG